MNKTPTFDDFWRVYPLKKGKEGAKKAWNRLTAAEKRKAVAAVSLYINDCHRSNIDRYKYPQGWLNDKRWQDYEEEMDVSGFRIQCSGMPLDETGNWNLKPETNNPAALSDGMDKW